HLMHLAKRNIINESVTAKLYYPSRRGTYLTGVSVKLPEDFYEFLDGVNYQDQSSHKGIAYFYFLDAYLSKIHQPHADRLTYYDFVREKLEGRLYYEFLAFKLGSDFKAELYKQFDKRNPYPDLVQAVRHKYKPLEGMLEGGKAPKLKLQAPDGKKIDLKSFKGKLIYIDLWPT